MGKIWTPKRPPIIGADNIRLGSMVSRKRQGGAAWQPTDVAGCVLWLRPDLGLTAPGGSVTSWVDQAQGADFQPTVGSDDAQLIDVSGISVVRFCVNTTDKTGVNLRASDLVGNSWNSHDYTAFLVARYHESITTKTVMNFEAENLAGNDYVWYNPGMDGSFSRFVSNGPTWMVAWEENAQSGDLSQDTWYYLRGQLDVYPADAWHYASGVDLEVQDPYYNSGTPADADTSWDIDHMTIQWINVPLDATEYADYAEFIIYDRLLNAGEIAIVESYLATRYATLLP